MKIKMANWQMEERIETLSKYANTTGVIGYAVARNLQRLREAAEPYLTVKSKMLLEYGHPIEGNKEGRYIVDDPEKLKEFVEKLNEIRLIECEVNVYRIEEESFINWGLTSAEMESLVWMVEEGE